MTDPDPILDLDRRDGLPDALRVLAETYPRDTWERHPNFAGLVRFWMERHMMFRRLLDLLAENARARADGRMDFAAHAPRLSRYGGVLLNELHGHHHIEDMHYFPQLTALEPRLERGFALLDADHQAMDGLLHDMAQGANAVLQGGEVGPFLDRLDRFGALLERHLTDEEEIVVPVILDKGFDG